MIKNTNPNHVDEIEIFLYCEIQIPDLLKKNLHQQVTDMMVANSSNLIITVKPANQRTLSPTPRRGFFSRNSADTLTDMSQSHAAAATKDGVLHLCNKNCYISNIMCVFIFLTSYYMTDPVRVVL